MSFYSIIQLILLAILLAYIVYYVYTAIFNKSYQPFEWRNNSSISDISRDLRKAESKYPDKTRFFNFWFQIERLKKDNVQGLFAELGVYKGDSAQLLHLMDSDRIFHLFDTFEGFKEKDLVNETGKAATYTTRNFADTSIEKVKVRLNDEQFSFHQGYFPETTLSLEKETFALVNMDVDLYNPTKAGLEFFYPRLAPGGLIIIHDYNPDWPGIMKAVDDFANTIPESLVILPDQDSSVMIFKSK